MKKKRTIIINNPKLKEIRNNLRNLWLEWGESLWFKIDRKREQIQCDEEGKPTDLPLFNHLREEEVKISRIMDDSICNCSVCNAKDRNMTYNPLHKEWYCTECYEENQEFYKNTEWEFLFP